MKPDWAIKANGKDVTETFRPFLISIRVRDESKDEADSCSITLADPEGTLVPPTQGDELEVLLGYDGELLSVGKFVVDEATFGGPPDEVVISCKSAQFAKTSVADGLAVQSWLVRKTRSWNPATIETVAKKLAAEHGVKLVAPAGLLLYPTPHLDQTEESDTGFLYRVVSPRGFIVKVANGALILVRRNAGVTYNLQTGQPIKQVTISRSEVSLYSGRWQERAVFDKAVAWWHNPATGQAVYETAGTGDKVYRFQNPAPDQKTAQDWASAFLRKGQGDGGRMELRMAGRADLQTEQLVVLDGFRYPLSTSPSKAAVAKSWILKSVEHVLNRNGFTTTVSGEPFIDT